MSPNLRLFLGLAIAAFALDQGSKSWIVANLQYGGSIEVLADLFYLVHVRNPGAAFGLFADGDPQIRLTVFIGVSLVAVLIVLSFFRQLAPGDRLSSLALGLILGGAVGNLIDRIFRGEVVDFLHFRLWRGYSWPDFNLADSFIVVGVGFLVLELLATEGEDRAAAESDEPGG